MTRPKHGGSSTGRARRRHKRRLRALRVQAKRVQRNLRARGSQMRWRARPWWDRWPLEWAALERTMAEAYPHFARLRIGRTLVYHGRVDLHPIPVQRRLTILFPDRPRHRSPIAMADGPTSSRHRYRWSRPTSLCLWHPRDSDRMRWTPRHGLVTLIDLARLHLVKEVHWRVTGEWPGLEVHSSPQGPAGNEQRPATDSRAARARRETARQHCWCGRGRYQNCHGAIPPEQELELLGLTG